MSRELFDKHCRYGRAIVDDNPNAPDLRALKVVTDVVSAWYAKVPGPLPQIFLTDSIAVNAVAFKREGVYFIGLTTGLFYVMRDTFMRMLSVPDLFPEIGDPSKETTPAFLQVPPRTLQTIMARSEESRTIMPRHDERMHYAETLAQLAFMFAGLHEAAHIYNGHVDFLRSHSIIEIGEDDVEASPSASGASGDVDWTRWALEIDADSAAIFAMLRGCHNMRTTKPVREGRPSSRDAMIAMYTFFRILVGRHVVTGKRTATHPPSYLRMLHTVTLANEGAPRWTGEANLLAEGIAVISDVARAFATISAPPIEPTDAEREAARELGHEMFTELAALARRFAEEWRRLYPLLLPLARGHLVAPRS